MISENICRCVLSVGSYYKHPIGGVAQVLYSYSRCIYRPFRFIVTTKEGALPSKIIRLMGAWLKFVWLCLFGGIRIVHLHGACYTSFWRKCIFIYTAKFIGKKVIFHSHGGEFAHFASGHRRAVGRALRHVDVIVALSYSWQEYFQKEFQHPAVIVIPNIVEEPHFTAVSERWKTPFEALFLGHFTHKKGIYDLLDVIHEHIDELRGRFILHIGGNGDSETLQQKIADYGISDVARYEGWIKPEEKQHLFNRASLYTLPSYFEGLPISILEAMSYHLPILATTVGGIPEIVDNGKNGLLVTPGDKDAIYSALTFFITHPNECCQMGEKSWQKVQQHLPENIEKELTGLYTELLRKKKSGSSL